MPPTSPTITPSCSTYTSPRYTLGSSAVGIILTYDRYRPPATSGAANRIDPHPGVTQKLAAVSTASDTFMTNPARCATLSMKYGGTVHFPPPLPSDDEASTTSANASSPCSTTARMPRYLSA